jgi:hypothetical protein
MTTFENLEACMRAGDWDGAARIIEEHRRELEAILAIARERRRELGAALARVNAADGFARQGFGVSPGS